MAEGQMQTVTAGLEQYLQDFSALLKKVDLAKVETRVNLLKEAYKDDRFVFIIGNGGSGANARISVKTWGRGLSVTSTSRSGSG
jgi:phosphoheptose isomerase